MKYIPFVTPFIAAFLTLIITRFNEVFKRSEKEEVIKQILIKTLNGLSGNMLLFGEELLKLEQYSGDNLTIYSEMKFFYIRKGILNNINKEDLNSFIIKYLNEHVRYFIEFEGMIEFFEDNGINEAIKKRNTCPDKFKDYVDYTHKDILKNFNLTDQIQIDLNNLPKLNSFKRKIYKCIF